MEKQAAPVNWRTNLLVTGGVLLTVVMALLLSQFDALQVRLPPTPAQLLAQVEETRRPATAVALTNTPLPAVTLANPSATPPPEFTPTGSSSQGTILCGPIPPGWSLYEVRSGDSLLALSAISGASVAEISRLNCLQNGLLVDGMRLYLPVRRPTPVVCGPPWGWTQYRVARGDTMFALALRHGTTVYAIMQANCLSNSALVAGRTLFLPPLWATATPIRPLPTATLLATATPRLTPTGTGTAVFTPSATPSNTPTPGGTPIITVTATLPATVSPTASPSGTATGEPTAAPTASATPEPGQTPSATPPPATATATSAPPSPTATTAPPTATSVPSTATTAPPTATTAPDP